MSAPKTIYTDGHKNLIEGIFEAAHHADKQIHEYRLVDPNEQSKIERIKAEVESLPYRKFSDDHPDQLIKKARCLEIIDRICNESDITDNGGDS